MSFLAELKRRNVFRMAGLYLVGAWLIIQIAETLLPAFEVPSWVLRAVIIVLALGFLPAVVFSWVFELTPEGLKRDHEVDRARSITSQTAERLDRLILVGLALLILIVVGDRVTRDRDLDRGADPDPTVAAESPSNGGKTHPVAASANPRLAVLPLANFSPDPNNAFFADGLHDDLLTALSRLQGIEVISRTTMQTFKGSTQKLVDIAKELDATHVIEGSVRRDASQVRLTIQLIDPRNDAHLWAENYDRPISDSLNLQSAVAREVAGALKLAIGGGEQSAPTSVPAAYDLFLQARLTTVHTDAYQLLDAALLLDPAFSLARAERAIAACVRVWFSDPDAERLSRQARADIDLARAERPELIEVQLAEAYYVYYVQRDYPAALQLAEKAVQAAPNDVRAMRVLSLLLRRIGRLDEAIEVARRALALDPADPNAHQGVVDMLIFQHPASREAIAVADAAIARFPRVQTGRLRLYRQVAVSSLTGAPMTREMLLAHDITGAEVEMFLGFAPADVPTPQSLARMQAKQDEWCGFAPCAVWLAREAAYLGDEAVLPQAIAAAERAYAALSAQKRASQVDFDVGFAYYLALRNAPVEQVVQMVEQALVRTRESEPTDLSFNTILLAKPLAAVGETGRAMDMIEALHASGDLMTVAFYHDPYLQRWMADEPRFEALRQRVAATFEPL